MSFVHSPKVFSLPAYGNISYPKKKDIHICEADRQISQLLTICFFTYKKDMK